MSQEASMEVWIKLVPFWANFFARVTSFSQSRSEFSRMIWKIIFCFKSSSDIEVFDVPPTLLKQANIFHKSAQKIVLEEEKEKEISGKKILTAEIHISNTKEVRPLFIFVLQIAENKLQ